jgi:hypothetical protein
MELEASLMCSQESAIVPYLASDESSPHSHILFIFNINFNIVMHM